MVLGESLPKILNDSLPIVSLSNINFELIVSNDSHCYYKYTLSQWARFGCIPVRRASLK